MMAAPDGVGEDRPTRILFVFAWLVVGGEETEVRLLAEHLPRERYSIDVIACFRRPGMPDQSHGQLAALGVPVDTTPYALDFADTVAYLAGRIPAYDIVVSCQNVADIYPALERLQVRPPLIEHGGLVSEAEAGPKHFTTRYVGVCETIRAAAAARMPGHEDAAIAIPSMVDVRRFASGSRAATREGLGIAPDEIVVTWLGRLDRKKNVEQVIEAAALAAPRDARLRFLIVGGPDAFMPEYEDELRALASARGLNRTVVFLGDRDDVGDLLQASDIFVWLSRGEGMPHVVAEAGAAGLPVIVTPDNGVLEQVVDRVSGLFAPFDDPAAVAEHILALSADLPLRQRLGRALQAKVERTFSTTAVIPRWRALFDDLRAQHRKRPHSPNLFASFFQGGFECSSHRRSSDRARRDMIALTHHDRHAESDYAQLSGLGIFTVRDGLRWHLVETVPGHYDWASLASQLEGARESGVQVIWDLMHYGWPDHVDVSADDFAARFAGFARAAALQIADATGPTPLLCAINEISFLAWAGGEVAYLNPFTAGRGGELKSRLVRAALAAQTAIREVLPGARFVAAEPIINVVAATDRPEHAAPAERHRLAQLEAFDMLAGRCAPKLGGSPDQLDIVGVNFYSTNNWEHGGAPFGRDDPRWRPLADMLAEVHARTNRPLFIAETGIEGDARAEWFDYVCHQVLVALDRGIPVEGICLYPVLGHIGWDDERYCPNGLLEADCDRAPRRCHDPLRARLRDAQAAFAKRNIEQAAFIT